MSESSSNSNLDGKAEEDSVAINPENKELKEEKSLCFVKVSNKWNVLIDSTFCGNECLGYNSNVVCMNGIGFIQTSNETNIRYFNSKDKHGITKRAEIIAENCFNKPNEYSEISQLNYYEIKLQTEGNTWIEIGFKKANDFYVNFKLMGCSISYNYNFKYFKPPSICLKNGDVLGCGLVYPSGNINNKFPYVFFTHNGEQKGKSILIKQNYEYLHPYVDLENCSIETNFGNDLNNNSFVYNVYEHKVAEEFYNCCEDDFLKITQCST